MGTIELRIIYETKVYLYFILSVKNSIIQSNQLVCTFVTTSNQGYQYSIKSLDDHFIIIMYTVNDKTFEGETIVINWVHS